MINHERIVASTRDRIGAILGLRAATVALSIWLLVWGTVVLVMRAVWLVPRDLLLWGLVGVIGAIVVGIVVSVQRRPPSEAVRALLDVHWQCGGLLMAAADTDTGDWRIKVPLSAVPRVRWRGARQGGILLCCVCFLLATFFVPARFLEAPGSQRLVVGAEVEKLTKKIELLKEEKILPPEKALSLEQSLEQLQRDATGNDPAKTWEAMDHLEQSVAKAAAQAAEETAREAQQTARAEELAAALEKSQGQMAAAELAAAMEILAKDVQQAAEESAALQGDLSEELKKQLEKGSLTPEQLAELTGALGECKACDLATLTKLADARLIDPSLLKELQGQCEIDPDALAALLAECQGGNCPCVADVIAMCNKPGRGGVSRGRGDASMTWTDGVNKEDAKFKEKVLSPGAVASLKDSSLRGVSVGDPTAAKPGDTTAGGALDVTSAGRGSARTQVILPEYRKVIQRYFAREPKGRIKSSEAP